MNVMQRNAMIADLHAQGLDDVRIAYRLGVGRTCVQKVRSGLGLPPPQPKKPPAPKPKREYVTAPRNTGGGTVLPLARQVDRFLAAFEVVEYAKPEESERAKEAGRLGRMPSPPVTATAPSSLERC